MTTAVRDHDVPARPVMPVAAPVDETLHEEWTTPTRLTGYRRIGGPTSMPDELTPEQMNDLTGRCREDGPTSDKLASWYLAVRVPVAAPVRSATMPREQVA